MGLCSVKNAVSKYNGAMNISTDIVCLRYRYTILREKIHLKPYFYMEKRDGHNINYIYYMMNKKVIIITIVVLAILESVIFFYKQNAENSKKYTQNSIESEVVLASSKEGYNSVVVYQLNNALIVSAESEAAFFDGVRYEVETQGNVDSSDIDIVWTNIGGGTEKTEDNDLIIAEIKISENGKLTSDTKINFAKNAFDALEDVLKSNKR